MITKTTERITEYCNIKNAESKWKNTFLKLKLFNEFTSRSDFKCYRVENFLHLYFPMGKLPFLQVGKVPRKNILVYISGMS